MSRQQSGPKITVSICDKEHFEDSQGGPRDGNQNNVEHTRTIRAQPVLETDHHHPAILSGDIPQTLQYHNTIVVNTRDKTPKPKCAGDT